MSMNWLEILALIAKWLPVILEIIEQIQDELEKEKKVDDITTAIGTMLIGGVKSADDARVAIATTLGVSPDRLA